MRILLPVMASAIVLSACPQTIDPKNAMPEIGITDQDARDISAYLYTLR